LLPNSNQNSMVGMEALMGSLLEGRMMTRRNGWDKGDIFAFG
jgi:hypothetical protein